MIFKLKITAGSPSLNVPTILEFECDNLKKFKEKFLKRFGNIGGTNNAERERLEVKQGVKRARSIKEVEEVFFNADYWHMDLSVNKKPAPSANDTSN